MKMALDVVGVQAGVTGRIFNTVGSGVKGGGVLEYVSYGATKPSCCWKTQHPVSDRQGQCCRFMVYLPRFTRHTVVAPLNFAQRFTGSRLASC